MTDHLDTIGPLQMPRYRPAYLAILEVLSDGQWHAIDETKEAAEAASDLAPKTIDNLIRWGHKRGRTAEWNYRGTGRTKQLRRPIERTAR